MTIILEREFEREKGLRAHGAPLKDGKINRHIISGNRIILHRLSEDVLTSNVFGVLKNLDLEKWLKPFISQCFDPKEHVDLYINDNFQHENVCFHFWHELGRPQRPKGHEEYSTQVDLFLELKNSIISFEIKYGARLDLNITTDIPDEKKNRKGVPIENQWDQVIRNIERGYIYTRDNFPDKQFYLVILAMEDESEKQKLFTKYVNNPKAIKNQIEQPYRWNGTEYEKYFDDTTYERLSKKIAWQRWENLAVILSDTCFDLRVEERFRYDVLDYLHRKIQLHHQKMKR